MIGMQRVNNYRSQGREKVRNTTKITYFLIICSHWLIMQYVYKTFVKLTKERWKCPHHVRS